MVSAKQSIFDDVENDNSPKEVSPISKEIVVGLVGHAGAGTSTAGDRIIILLEKAGYHVHKIKISELIHKIDPFQAPRIKEGAQRGISRFGLATALQDRGDALREKFGDHALAVAAIAKLKLKRGKSRPGESKLAFVIDSLKHPAEVSLLRKVYDHSFRLVAVHCDVSKREERLIGDPTTGAKYSGAPEADVKRFMERDSKDDFNSHGQRVRDVFHQADFFLDNTVNSHVGAAMSGDIDRFVSLLIDRGLVRPTQGERAIYLASAAALQSSCLSRQVGAALIGKDGNVVAIGTNDAPKFGGGVYDEDSSPDHRCFAWEFSSKSGKKFVGCHNDRKKSELYDNISRWMSLNLSEHIAEQLHPKDEILGTDFQGDNRRVASEKIAEALKNIAPMLRLMPGVKDAIEYSRAIHAEMSALLSATRNGYSTVGCKMYVTTYPCHNCARHLVAAGVSEVYFVEPYVKSLAAELHSDAIVSEAAPAPDQRRTHMLVAPFTGVGPRMYEDFFAKRSELKDPTGAYSPKTGGEPYHAVRLRNLTEVENEAMKLFPAVEAIGSDNA